MKTFLLIVFTAFAAILHAQTPVQGNDLPRLLGQFKSAAQVQSMEKYIAGDFESRGIKLNFSSEGLLTRIELYNDKSPWGDNIQQFKGTMPLGLTFTDNIATAKKKFGEGFEVDGEVAKTYYVMKRFELDNINSYKLSAEYMGGRFISLTMILEEGGSGDLMEDGTVNKTGFKGENLISMVKKYKANLELQKLVELFDTFYTYSDKTHIIYANKGLEVITDYQGVIQEVIVYSGGQQTSVGHTTQAFPYPLPYGIKFQDSKSDVVSKLGPPLGEDKGGTYYNFGPSRMSVFFGANKVSKVVISINPDYKPAPKPKHKQVKP